MDITIRTIIESVIDLDTFELKHSTEIKAEDWLPKEVVLAAVVGGCDATLAIIGDPFASDVEDAR